LRDVGAEAGRGRDGRFQSGNIAALVVGDRSMRFWRAQADARRAIEAELLSDAGFRPDDAPAALRLAVEAITQATLIQRSAFERIGEAGGPLTIRGRGRRAFLVWLQASDRLDRSLRLVGLERKARPVPTVAEYIAAHDADRRETP
jgi:hypothetical protein